MWHVPEAQKNLFSVLAAHDKVPTSNFVFDQLMCKFEINGKTLFTGIRSKVDHSTRPHLLL